MSKICTGCRDGVDFEIPFTMAYQPIVDTELGKPFAYEALVRGADGSGALRQLGVRYHQGYWYAKPEIGRLPEMASQR